MLAQRAQGDRLFPAMDWGPSYILKGFALLAVFAGAPLWCACASPPEDGAEPMSEAYASSRAAFLRAAHQVSLS